MIRIMHVTDTHAQQSGINAAKVASDMECDMYVHTGDMVVRGFEDATGGIVDTIFCPVIGNHDVITNEGLGSIPYDWTKQATQEQLLTKFFPHPERHGVEMLPGQTWWKRDMGEAMLIGLNFTVQGEVKNTHHEWLESLLDDCLAIGKPVILASHDGCDENGPVMMKCDWTAELFDDPSYRDAWWGSMFPFIAEARSLVNDFVYRGGVVLLWFYGHAHADGFSTDFGYPHVVLGSSIVDEYNDLNRCNDGCTESCVVNVYEIDLENNSLSVYRLGADTTFKGRWRRMLVYNYIDGTVQFA